MAVLIAYGLATGLAYLGSAPLLSHEGLAAERTRELMTVGGWIMPHLGGRPDARKPPLPFWIGGALAVAAGGMSEWTARLPSVAASLGTMVLLVLWMRRVADLRAAVITGVIYLTSAAALVYGRRAEVDMQLAFWTTAALVSAWLALQEPDRRRQLLFAAGMWASLALGVLTKGPLPLGIAAVALLAAALFSREARRIGRLHPLPGVLLFLAVVLPWGLHVILQWPKAAEVWYIESAGRYVGEFGHYKPWHYYATRAPVLWLPWLPLVAYGVYAALRREAVRRAALVFLLAWGVGGLVFLSFNAGKRLHYALVAAPPFLVLAGIGAAGLRQPVTRAGRWLLASHWLLVPAAMGGGIWAAWAYPEFRAAVLAAACVAAVGIACAILLAGQGRMAAALAAVAAVVLGVHLIAAGHVAPALAAREDVQGRMGRWLAAELPADADVRFFREPMARVLFSAGRIMPVLPDAEAAAAWRTTARQAYLILVNAGDRADADRAGPWQEVRAWDDGGERRALLRPASEPRP